MSCLCAFEFVRCVRGVSDCGCVHVLVSGGACVDMCECVCLGVWVSGCECGYVTGFPLVGFSMGGPGAPPPAPPSKVFVEGGPLN